MTGYRVSPQGVDQTLERVRTEADRLGRALDAAWSRLPPAAGGSRIVADALGGFAEFAQDKMSAVGERLEAAPGALVRAVAAILEGDEQMAAATLRAMSAEQGPADVRAPFGPPTGLQGPPVPPGGEPLFDPKRFGGTLTPETVGQQPGFDTGRFGGASAAPGSATGSDS